VLKIAFFAVVVSFGWYLIDEVYGKQQLMPLADSNVYKADSAIPELTIERIEVLRRIAGMSNENESPSVDTSVTPSDTNPSDTSNAITLNGASALPSGFEKVNNLRSTDSEWESYQGIDQYNGTKEGFAVSGWTTLSPSNNWSDENIQAALVAGCNDDGERSLHIKMLSSYLGSETDRSENIVNGKIGWDSSKAYGASFTYDGELNALRLRAGLEDTLSMIRDGKKVTIQIPWRDSKQGAFEFSLKGSSQALNSAFDYCSSSHAS